MPPTHYDTLGVSRTASLDEIKAKFRQLSKESHPDVAGNTTANVSRFQQISHAASVLTNKTKKEHYDLQLERPFGANSAWAGHHAPGSARRPPTAGPTPTTGFQVFLQTIFRPRNMVLGSLAVYTVVATYRSYAQPATPSNTVDLVQAWKNPTTGEWEQPAPWDPTYRRLKPRLTMVPREQVKTRHR